MPEPVRGRPAAQLMRCTPAHVPRLAWIRRTREDWMSARGIVQWPTGSLAEAEILAQVERGEWFRLVEGSDAADGAAATLRAAARLLEADPEFWGEDEAPALYVHGLMVDLAAAGRGLGERLLELAGAEGRRRRRGLLRLDCAPHLVGYYRRRGFTPVRRTHFPDFTTVLLERPLT